MAHLRAQSLAADRTHVFPAEIAAAFWRRAVVEATERRAIREDHIVSWDTFKEALFRRRSARRPVNRVARRLFARWLAEENARSPFLGAIIEPGHAAHSTLFVGKVERLLPPLHHLRTRHSEKLDESYRHDIDEIYHRYAHYLQSAGRFEPSWESVPRPQEVGRYQIHFPEVIEDFPEFAHAIAELPSVSLRSVPEDAGGTLYEFANAHEEVTWLVGELERLLDLGVHPESIAVTVGDAERWVPYLLDMARRREVPVVARSGKALSDYPAGRLFPLLRDLSTDDFSLEAMKSLLLNGAVPIRDRAAARTLVRIGIDSGIVRRSVQGKRDEWEQVLRGRTAQLAERERKREEEGDAAGVKEAREAKECAESALALYRGLARSVHALTSAETFVALRRELYRFFAEVLDSDAWDDGNELVLQRCLELLSSCIDENHEGYAVGSPFSVYLTLLDGQIYVPRGSEAGIPVYPYRVAAGISPAYHFVVNCGNEAVRAVSAQWSFLREDQREQLGLHGADMTDAFLRLYAGSGEHVTFSYARESFSGAQIAPFAFVGDGSVAAAPPPAADFGEREADRNAADREAAARIAADQGGAAAAESGDADLYEMEPALWSGGLSSPPQRLYPAQLAGARYMAHTGLLERDPDFGRSRIAAGPLRDRLILRCSAAGSLQRADGEAMRIQLSATDLKRYLACPFSYLLMRPLSVDEKEYRVDQDDPRLLGNLYHDLLEQLFATIREEDGVLRSDRLDRYREIVGELLTALVEGRFPASRRLLPPARGAAALRLEGAIGPLLQEELESHSGYRILKEEGWHRATLSEPNVELVGRIDRLLRNSETGTLVLIDYKRKNLPKKRELGVEEPRETLAEMQLPLYALLFEANDGQLERVLYCSIENGAWQRVYDEGGFPGSDPWHGAETWAAALDEVRSRVAETADAIRSGDFRFPEPEQGCETCVFRGICRTKFRVR